MAASPHNFHLGILKNVSPIPPPSVVSTIELDQDVILPILHPVLASISLQEISSNVQELIAQNVRVLVPVLPKAELTDH